MSETKLRRCQFCGDEPLVRFRGGAWGVNCAGSSPAHSVWVYGKTEGEAVATWNTPPANQDESRG